MARPATLTEGLFLTPLKGTSLVCENALVRPLHTCRF